MNNISENMISILVQEINNFLILETFQSYRNFKLFAQNPQLAPFETGLELYFY